MTQLRWGILGTANFALNKMLPALQQCEHAIVTAIGSRDVGKARIVAEKFGIGKAYGSYDDLLADPDLDVIYNPLPNHLHVPWTIRAIESGKHVLCEKPVALTANEAQDLLDISNRKPKIKVMEAFMYRFHPQWQYTKHAVSSRSIGELRSIHSHFSYFNSDAGNIRNQTAAGGGGLMDIGCYNISLSRFLFGAEPKQVVASLNYDPTFETDRRVSGILEFETGTATFTCSTQMAPFQHVTVLGTDGRMELEIPFNAPADAAVRLLHQQGSRTDEVRFDPCNQYTVQADQFSLSVLNDKPVPIPLPDAVANMKVIDAIRDTGRTKTWVSLRP